MKQMNFGQTVNQKQPELEMTLLLFGGSIYKVYDCSSLI